MLARLRGQLFRDDFGVNLISNSNLGLINSGEIFKVKQYLTIGFRSFSFVCFGTFTFVMLQLLAPQLHTAMLLWKLFFPLLSASPLAKSCRKNATNC